MLIILVVLPLWTSVTTAWAVLLQRNGLVNDALMSLHTISQPLELIFNRVGTIIAMTHIQLPVHNPADLQRNEDYLAQLGTPFHAFRKVYFPQTLSGIAAGCLLTFILCLGYYITPALVEGRPSRW